LQRILEAYVGEYASGKSENAVNRSLQLIKKGRKVRLVDLDVVEPFYTLRPLKKILEQMGIDVLAWETAETIGLGEAAIPLKKETIRALEFDGDLIFDLGYGIDGCNILKIIKDSSGEEKEEKIKIIMVVNITRPLTSSVPLILKMVNEFEEVDGLINNTHLGEETTIELIQKGAIMVTEVAKKLSLPVVATTALRDLASRIGEFDVMGNKVWPIDRYMSKAIW
jgi:predicted HTH domain antitoxin